MRTNKHNLPIAICQAIGEPRKPVPFRFSVSDFTNDPWMRKLREREFDNIVEDYSDFLWALMGQAPHYILHQASPKNALAEEKLVLDYSGKGGTVTISGIPDLWHDEVLDDYKVTSVYAYLLGEKKEWEVQLNIYRYLLADYGFKTKLLRIYAILRDWQKSKTLSDPDYPKIPFQEIKISLWSEERVTAYIDAWLEEYVITEGPCSDEARWMRPTTYAVMKVGNKRALRVLDSFEEATKWVEDTNPSGKTIIEERKGKYIRCESYCSVREFCKHNPYRQGWLPGEEV